MKDLILLFAEVIVAFCFMVTLLAGIVEVVYNTKANKPTKPFIWVLPSAFFALLYLLNSIQNF